MERCPNCGAPARAGARFCTTCGYRLPENADAATSVAAEQSSPETPVEPAGGAPAAEFDAASTAAAGAAEAGPARDAGDTGNADQVLASSWPSRAESSWSGQWPAVEAAETGDVGAASAGEDASTEGGQATWSGTAGADVDEANMAPSPAAGGMGAEASAAGWVGHPFTPSPEASMLTPSSSDRLAPESSDGPAGPVVRAVALLDELRALLPTLASTGTVDPETVAADLEAALAAARAEESEGLAELRMAMLAARDRPRDIDTVLDLSRRVDDVLALLDAHEHCVAAIERAILALRGG